MKIFRFDLFPGDGSPTKSVEFGLFALFWRLFFLGVAVTGFVFFDPVAIWQDASDAGLVQLEERNRNLEKDLAGVEHSMLQARNSKKSVRTQRDQVFALSGFEKKIADDGQSLRTESGVEEASPDAWRLRLFSLKKSFRQMESMLENDGRKLPLIHPLISVSPLGSLFGKRKDVFTGTVLPHNGIDYLTDVGDSVIAPADGIVLQGGRSSGFGRTLILAHGKNISTFYAHLASVLVPSGRNVKRGQVIGTTGSTGRSSGPKLHYEIRLDGISVNPLEYILP